MAAKLMVAMEVVGVTVMSLVKIVESRSRRNCEGGTMAPVFAQPSSIGLQTASVFILSCCPPIASLVSLVFLLPV